MSRSFFFSGRYHCSCHLLSLLCQRREALCRRSCALLSCQGLCLSHEAGNHVALFASRLLLCRSQSRLNHCRRLPLRSLCGGGSLLGSQLGSQLIFPAQDWWQNRERDWLQLHLRRRRWRGRQPQR